MPTRLFGMLFSLFLGLLLVGGTAGTAHAEDGYRYWNYSHLPGGTWQTAKTGADGYVPKDGAVEGYRFGVSTMSQAIYPRADLDKVSFDAVCGSTDAGAGKKRVAVVVDPGTKADADGATPPAPFAKCAVVDKAANGQQALASVVDIRSGAVPTCAIDGYPAKGCGDPVKNATVSSSQAPVAFELPTTTPAKSSSGGSQDNHSNLLWPVAALVVVVGAVGAGAFAMNSRKRDA